MALLAWENQHTGASLLPEETMMYIILVISEVPLHCVPLCFIYFTET